MTEDRKHKSKIFQGTQFTDQNAKDIVGTAEFRNCGFEGLALKRRQLEECLFLNCSFVKADFTNARLNGSTFRSCDLSGLKIAGCNLFGVTFEDCKMLGIDFKEGVIYTAASSRRCNLDYTIFRGVSLAKMVFEKCSFEEADLSLTDLEQASFMNCNLTHADHR
jgi:fluoroquinolone resistance protein